MSYQFGVKHTTGLPRLGMPRATAVNNKRLRSITIRSGQSWVAPPGVYRIRSLQGKGSDGEPTTGAHDYVDGYDEYSQVIRHNNVTNENETFPEVYVGESEGPVPAAHCDTDEVTAEFTTATCYRYEYKLVDIGDYKPATAGVAATGFGKSFSGGPVGLDAVPQYYFSIAVIPGNSYPLVIPSGGFITISY